MNSISKRLKEIDEEISRLYNEKRILEMEQQEYWRKMGWTHSIYTARREDAEPYTGYMADSEINYDYYLLNN